MKRRPLHSVLLHWGYRCVVAPGVSLLVLCFCVLPPAMLAGNVLMANIGWIRPVGYHEEVVPLQVASECRLQHGESGDFDGDGVLDSLTMDALEFPDGWGTSERAVVRIRSGADQSVLLEHDTGVTVWGWVCGEGHWCGDIDGNGTDDVLFSDDRGRYALGSVR